MIIGDSEDPPPNTPPAERTTLAPEEFEETERITQVETPVPQREPRKETRTITLGDVLDAVAELSVKLDTLNNRVGGIDAGLSAAWSELAALRGDMSMGFDGVIGKQIAHGTVLAQIANDVGIIREQTDSALGAVAAMGPRSARIEERQSKLQRVAFGTWVQVTTGKVDASERDAIDAIVVSDSAAR